MENTTINNLLTEVLSDVRGVKPTKEGEKRRYQTTIGSSATMGAGEDVRTHRIKYEVGRRHENAQDALAANSDPSLNIGATYDTSSELISDFSALAKKYTNFGAVFHRSNLAGLAERLAKTVAAQSMFGGVNSTMMRGGKPLFMSALGTYDAPINSLSSFVFIPRQVQTILTGDVFSALANAVAGEGSQVATDFIELANGRQPKVALLDGNELAAACVEALRIVGANMEASNQGPLFALAVTRGIHQVVSVVAHTDEGGLHRSLFRCGAFTPPFGGIHYELDVYCGLPSIGSGGDVELHSWVDGIAMMTAALVAHCDPGLRVDGMWYPTILLGADNRSGIVAPGAETPATNDMAVKNRGALLNCYNDFLSLYIPALAKLFKLDGHTDKACIFQYTCAQFLSRDERHLKLASVAPFFWIEPTSLIPHNFTGNMVETEGFASLGGKNSTRSQTGFEAIVPCANPTWNKSSYGIRMRSARTSWFVLHWNGHPENGLSAVILNSTDVDRIVHPGPCGTAPTVKERIDARKGLNDYLWQRGQSTLCAPTEFTSLTGNHLITVIHGSDEYGEEMVQNHVPNQAAFANCIVSMNIGKPRGFGLGPANAESNGVRRARTRAMISLANIRHRVNLGFANSVEIGQSYTAPRIDAGLKQHFNTTPVGTDDTGTVSSGPRGAPYIPPRPKRDTSVKNAEAVVMLGATTGPTTLRGNVKLDALGDKTAIDKSRADIARERELDERDNEPLATGQGLEAEAVDVPRRLSGDPMELQRAHDSLQLKFGAGPSNPRVLNTLAGLDNIRIEEDGRKYELAELITGDPADF